jgi:hypothetical protein
LTHGATRKTPWWKDSPDGYEVLEDIKDETGEETLGASYTPNNGIRVWIANDDIGPECCSFDFSPDQAEFLANALLRWAKARRGP